MKLAFTVTLPRTEKRLQSPAWNRFVRDIERARLNMKIKQLEQRNDKSNNH